MTDDRGPNLIDAFRGKCGRLERELTALRGELKEANRDTAKYRSYVDEIQFALDKCNAAKERVVETNMKVAVRMGDLQATHDKLRAGVKAKAERFHELGIPSNGDNDIYRTWNLAGNELEALLRDGGS